MPLDPVTTVFQFALAHAVAVGKQIGVFGFISDNFGGEARQNVRAIQIPGNVPEAFRLTLGTQRFTRLIQPFQRGVRRRADFINDFQGKAGRQLLNNQGIIF